MRKRILTVDAFQDHAGHGLFHIEKRRLRRR